MIRHRYRLWRLRVALVAAVMIPGGAWAERVVVRSGEHPDFTRIVLTLLPAAGYSLDSDGNRARIAISGIDAQFDLGDAYRRLASGRVIRMLPDAGENTLTIEMSCACTLKAFRADNDLLAIDISGPPGTLTDAAPQASPTAAGASPVIMAVPTFTAPETRYRFPFEAGQAAPIMPFALGRDMSGLTALTPADRHAAQPREPAPPTAASTAEEAGAQARAERLTKAELQLAEQLGRAVSQGLVTPRVAHLPDPLSEPDRHPEAKDHAVEPAAEPPSGLANPSINLRAETSADRDFSRLLAAFPQTNTGGECFTDGELDISSWASDAPFGTQVGALRGGLLGEFDRPNADVARDLVRLYIRFGFGAEALQVLRVSGLSGGDTMLLKSTAEIMEYGHSLGPGPLSDQYECDSHAALWAVLSGAEIPADAQPNAAAILRAVDALPPQLRGLLGPMASDRLIAARHPDLAAQVLRIVERGIETPTAGFEMADAGISLAEGDIPSAERALDSVIDSNTELSPKALIALIDTRLENGLPVDLKTADLAGAYAHEYRKDPLGAELKRVHILALAEAGAFDDAFAELALFARDHDADTNRMVRSHAMAALARDADDVTFLKHALDLRDPETATLASSSGDTVAERLIALGFPHQAEPYLAGPAEAGPGRIRQLLRARAALDQGRPRRAEDLLFGLTGPEADTIRAEARSMDGDHVAAARLFATLDRPEDSVNEAWLASNWRTLRQSDDPLWQRTADIATGRDDAAAPLPEGVLARDRALIEDSMTARETLTQLLDRLNVNTADAPPE